MGNRNGSQEVRKNKTGHIISFTGDSNKAFATVTARVLLLLLLLLLLIMIMMVVIMTTMLIKVRLVTK